MDRDDSIADTTELSPIQNSENHLLSSDSPTTQEVLQETSQTTIIDIFKGILSTENEQREFSKSFNSTSEELRGNVTVDDTLVNELAMSESYVFIVLCVVLITTAVIIAVIITVIIIRRRHIRRKPYLRVSYASESELAAHKIETTHVPEDVLNKALADLYQSLALDALNVGDVESGLDDCHKSTDNCADETSDEIKAKLAASAGSLLNAHEEAMSYSLHAPKNNIHKSLPFLDEKIYKATQNNLDVSDITEHLLDKNRQSEKENPKKKNPKRYSMASFSDLKLTHNFLKDKDRVRKADANQSASNDKIWQDNIPVSVKVDPNHSESQGSRQKQIVPPNAVAVPKNSEEDIDNVFEALLDKPSAVDEPGKPRTNTSNHNDDSNFWTGSKSCDNLDLGSKTNPGNKSSIEKGHNRDQKRDINGELPVNGSRKRT